MPRKAFYFAVIIFACCNAATALGQSDSKKYRILTYGLVSFHSQNARNIVADRWHIEFYPVAGCVLTQPFKDSVDKENEKINKLLSALYGKDWEDRLDKEIDKETEIEAKIDEIVRNQPFIAGIGDLPNPLPGAPFPMHPIDKKGNYLVSVSTYNRDWKEQKLYTLQVNYKTGRVKIITDYTK